MKNLIDRRKEIIHETEAAKKEGSQIRAPVITWLEDVEMLQPRVNRIHENQPSTCFLNFSKRYKSSREVEEILDNIKRLLKAGKFPHDLLSDDRFQRIGIWGLGGVGKSTMVITLNNELKSTSRNIFGVIVPFWRHHLGYRFQEFGHETGTNTNSSEIEFGDENGRKRGENYEKRKNWEKTELI